LLAIGTWKNPEIGGNPERPKNPSLQLLPRSAVFFAETRFVPESFRM